MPRPAFIVVWVVAMVLIGLSLAGSGCSYLRPQKGGTTQATLGTAQTIVGLAQPENPAQGASQTATRTESRETPVSTPSIAIVEEKKPDGTVTTTRTEFAPQIAKETLSTGTSASVGAAQKDSGREIAARLAAMRPIQFVGVGLMVFAAAGLYYAPLRILLGGGKQLVVVLGFIGLGLVIAPQLIAGNETLVLIIGAVGGLIYWLSIRLTRKEAEADSLNKVSGNGKKDLSPQ